MIQIQGKARYILLTAGVLLTIFLIWYFSAIVTYILISAVLSLIGRPLVRLLQQVRIRQFRISAGLAAMITLIGMWIVFITALRFLIPLLISEFEQLSSIRPETILNAIEEPLREIMIIAGKTPAETNNGLFLDYIRSEVANQIGFAQLTNIFGFIAGTLGGLFIASFAISFITFFFLKDENMFKDSILLMIPSEYEGKVEKVIHSVHHLLKRYFIGLVLEVIMVGLLVTLGLSLIGIEFSHAVAIGLFCGMFNIIPYLGPWMGAILGLVIGVAINVHADFMAYTLPLLGLMLLVFITVQVIDNILFQPLIYSSSVKAHPLEIFLVILAAGMVAGIIGMFLAIPAYTICRVIAKEFLDNLKIVRKLTESLDN